jgi:hypothetical protein
MVLTNAEKQAAWRARRDQHIKSLEKQVKQLKEQIEKLKVAPEDAQGRQTHRHAAAGIRLGDWEILVDDDGEGYLSAHKEPYGLYVRQIDGACFFWHVITDRDDDVVGVAEGETPTVVAAMAAAETAVRGLGKKVAKKR